MANDLVTSLPWQSITSSSFLIEILSNSLKKDIVPFIPMPILMLVTENSSVLQSINVAFLVL